MKPLFLLFSVLFFWSHDLFAEPHKHPLSEGMTYGQVVASWGDPTEKTEKEIKREEVWTYGSSKVIFHEGKLRSWTGESIAVSHKVGSSKSADASPPEKEVSTKDSVAVEDILSEIMKNVPSDDSPPSGMNAPGALPGVGVPPPMPLGGE